jgi:hypothetical protein
MGLSVVAVLIGLCAGPSVQADIVMNLNVNGNPIGQVAINITAGTGGQGLTGGFTAAGGQTLAQLEAALGQDHLNWFQKVIADSNPPKDAAGNQLAAPYVDPPSGGYSNQWADNIPWYWDEVVPPNGTPNYDPNLQLSNNITNGGKTLNYEDFPGGPNANVSFVTFLVSDYGNNTYSVLGGFSWSVTINNGTTTVNTLTANAAFKPEYSTEIKAFGFTQVPEPSSLLLVSAAIPLVCCFYRSRFPLAKAA